MSREAFSKAEYQRRHAAVRARAQEEGVDAFIVTDDGNITYLIGFPAKASAGQAQAAIVLPNESEPYFICRPMDRQGALICSYYGEDRLIGYPEDLVSNRDRNGYDFIFDFVRDLVGAGAKIGMEFDDLSIASYRQAEAAFGSDKLHDLSGVVHWARFVYSDEEAANDRQAAAITDAAMRKAVEVIKPGVRQCDAAAEIIAVTCRGLTEYGGDWPAYPEIPAGERAMCPHLSWTDEPYPDSGHVNCELAGWRYRYAAALARTVSIGAPSDGLRRVFDANVAGVNTILSQIKTGAVCQDLWRAYNQEIGKHGFHKDSRCGYPIGIEWDGGSVASIAEGDETVLQDNMVMHIMVGLWANKEENCVLSETIRVTPEGPEIFGSIPREILIA